MDSRKIQNLHTEYLLEGLFNLLKNESVEELEEKSVSKAQQKFMGMVHSAQKGEKPASKEVAKVAKSMGKKDVTDFAKTKLKGLPEKVEEDNEEVTDEELSMFSRKKSGTRGGYGQGDNPWNNMKKRGRGFKSRSRNECAVGTITDQNTTIDVNKHTPQKNLDAFFLEDTLHDMYQDMAMDIKTQLSEDVPPAGKGSEKLDQNHLSGIKGGLSIPGLSMNKSDGSSYMQYRFGLALAGAPEFPTAASGAVSGDPLLSTYTDEELEMIKMAAKQVGAGSITKLSKNRSEEIPGVNKDSPVAKIKRNQYGI